MRTAASEANSFLAIADSLVRARRDRAWWRRDNSTGGRHPARSPCPPACAEWPETPNRPSKLLAYFGILQRSVISALRHPDGQSRMEMRPPVQTFKLSTSLPRGGPELRRRETAVVEDHLAGRAGRSPSLFSFLPARNPGVPFSITNAEMPCCASPRSVPPWRRQTSA